MPRADQRLYTALLRLTRRFRAAGLPVLGIAGTDAVCYSLDWPGAVRQQLQHPPLGIGLAEGFKLLARLEQQLETLMQAEEHTREALAEWAALTDSFNPRPQRLSSRPNNLLPPAARAAAAAEQGLALLTRQAQQLTDPLLLDLELAGPSEDAEDGPAALSLDELAAAVQQQYPDLFVSQQQQTAAVAADEGAGDRDLRLQQLAALQNELYSHQRFKYEPFEWVYEGLQPLLLPQQLQRRKLAPLTLAVVAAGVGRRLGLSLLPAPAEGGEGIAATVEEGVGGGPAAQGLVPLDKLRPDVAQRYAGRAQGGMAPAAGPWVLLLPAAAPGAPSDSSSSSGSSRRWQQWSHAIDACTGEVMDAAAAQQRYPDLHLTSDWQLRSPLVGWQHMVRTIIQAHQRRGESDLVAHWVYVLLALDPQAAEWGHMLHDSSHTAPAG
ncbi:hypothetical protein D9Q98_009615 [Chlorella vulgaris]|uniref:Protein SirB1 N-terminal domain-containing protein n=1 Tax=Chlorella vulgaris TaxID=3077 RepID=A0A9D4TFL1_CHLVU|nr:hypothetical protein D9Q98_009615 [Chlorella vulgaris]